MKNEKTAWYLDGDVLLEGTAIRNKFYGDRNICGFDIQEFDADMIGREIFFDLEKALCVCGPVPIIKMDPNGTQNS